MTKRFKEIEKLVDKKKAYELKDAVAILKTTPPVKFDESVDLSIKLGVDAKETTQSVRGSVVLPNGTGKKIRVAVFCKGDDLSKRAKDAGAEVVGAQELIDKVAGGAIDFDIAVATPDMMKDMAKLGKVLGPRGLMPSPKAGTVTPDIEKAIKEVKAGKIEFKMDKLGCINIAIGKRSFKEEALIENAEALLKALRQAQPAQVKGKFLKTVAISTTMGPGLKLNVE